MKFFSLQENLKQGLFAVSGVSGKNINLPILNNIMIRIEGGGIKIMATNLEVGIVSTIRGKIEGEGVFTVDSKTFSDYVGLLPGNNKVEVEKKDNNLLIHSNNYKTKIRGQSAEDFPLIPEIKKDDYYSVDTGEFKTAISQVLFAASHGEARLELSGVLFLFSENTLTLAATDSYRLAEKTIKAKTNRKKEMKIIVPTRSLQELTRILSGISVGGVGDGGDEIKFYVSENQILAVCGSIELTSRLIEGQYPDYRQIIPVSSKTKATVNKAELVRAVKMASLFSKSGINDINLDFPGGKNKLVVSSTSGQIGENITTIDAKVTGDDNSMVVNYRYFLDGLNNVEGESVKLEIIDGNTPGVLKPEKKDDYLYIIMPIKQ